jgi:hypothetical protein
MMERRRGTGKKGSATFQIVNVGTQAICCTTLRLDTLSGTSAQGNGLLQPPRDFRISYQDAGSEEGSLK